MLQEFDFVISCYFHQQDSNIRIYVVAMYSSVARELFCEVST